MHTSPQPYICMHSGPALTKGSTHGNAVPQNVHKPKKPPNPEGRSTRGREDRGGDTGSADAPQRQPVSRVNTSQAVAVLQSLDL